LFEYSFREGNFKKGYLADNHFKAFSYQELTSQTKLNGERKKRER